MRSRYQFVEPDGLYFLSCTIVDWIPVFQSRPYFDIVVNALSFCRANKAMRLYAYVIMENHLHIVAGAPDLSRVVKEFKSFTAREIVALTETSGRAELLNRFMLQKKRYKDESRYQVWQEGAHPLIIRNDAVLNQKIAYIHNNPVRRGYVDAPEHWRYSSARNLYLDDHSVLEIDPLPA